MKNDNIEITVTDEGKHRIISIQGEVNLYSVSKLRKEIMSHVNESMESLIIDMKNLSHMDSSGIALLANLQKQIKSNGGAFYLLHVNEDIRNVLKLAALDRFFSMIDKVEDLN
jgi:anti-sigma B factor antagonist